MLCFDWLCLALLCFDWLCFDWLCFALLLTVTTKPRALYSSLARVILFECKQEAVVLSKKFMLKIAL